jgi:hypothetical protein
MRIGKSLLLLWNAAVLQAAVRVLFVGDVAHAATTTTSTSSQSSSSSSASAATSGKPSHRKNNLDYLNADTLDFFLSKPALDYDAVVLFYANWDRHSHTFASMYAQMAALLEAGSVESGLVLGLFDCEADVRHMELCTKAGVTHYPTTLYFSFATHRRHKFGGNWAYGDAVLDWIKTLRALSGWHRAGWGKRLRSWMFGGNKGGAATEKKPELPVGVPATSATPAPSSSASAAYNVAASKELEKLQEEKTAMNDLLVRSAAMMEAVLFPMTYAAPPSTRMQDPQKNYTDLFAYLNQTDGWASPTARPKVLRSCLQDVALEYCQRFTTIMTEEFLAAHPDVMADKDNEDLISQLTDRLQEQEPYCMLVDACIINGFVHAKCRPATCPFADPTACRFLTSCFYESMQQQYAKALGISLPNATAATSASAGNAASDALGDNKDETSHTAAGKKKSAWGFGA